MATTQSRCCRESSIDFDLSKVRCPHHLSRNRYCTLVTYQPAKHEEDHQLIAYGVSCNFLIPNIKYYCVDYACRRYSLLQTYHRLHAEDECHVQLRETGQKLVSMNLGVCLKELVFYVNNEAVFGTGKKLQGIRNSLIANFESKYLAENEGHSDCDAQTVQSLVAEEVVSKYYLQMIWDFLYIHVWEPANS